jgi:hypothetical protein
MHHTRSLCCVRDASGQADATPPSSAMNSRRLPTPPQNNGTRWWLRGGGHGSVGKLQRRLLRLSRVSGVVSTPELVGRAYPKVKPEHRQNWHFGNTRRAASRFWERCGHVVEGGVRYLLWRPKG